MERSIRDYLGFYLGCPCIDHYGNDIKTLHSVLFNEEIVYLLSKNNLKHKRKISEIELLPRDMNTISYTESLAIATIVCGKQYIEPAITKFGITDTTDPEMKIFRIEFSCFQKIKHTGDKPQSHMVSICDWGTINHYSARPGGGFELGNNGYQIKITEYLLRNHIDIFNLMRDGLINYTQKKFSDR